MGTKRLPPDEAERRAKERSKKSNARSKEKRLSEKMLGIPAKKKVFTEEQKITHRLRAKLWREKMRLLKPPRVKMTPEQYATSKRLASRKKYEKLLASKGLKPKRDYQPKSIKMEKILKSRPANRVSEKVIKPVKEDMSKQPVCKIKADDTGKVKFQLNERTWVMAIPGSDLNALRKKYLRI